MIMRMYIYQSGFVLQIFKGILIGMHLLDIWVPAPSLVIIHCEFCAWTGRSPIVILGPHGLLQLTKRATCSTRNVVYVGVCSRCEELGGANNWCVYFGETSQAFRSRCRQHISLPCNSSSVLKQNRFRTSVAKRAEIQRVLNDDDDDSG